MHPETIIQLAFGHGHDVQANADGFDVNGEFTRVYNGFRFGRSNVRNQSEPVWPIDVADNLADVRWFVVSFGRTHGQKLDWLIVDVPAFLETPLLEIAQDRPGTPIVVKGVECWPVPISHVMAYPHVIHDMFWNDPVCTSEFVRGQIRLFDEQWLKYIDRIRQTANFSVDMAGGFSDGDERQ